MTDSLTEEKTRVHTMPKTRLALLQAPRHTMHDDSGGNSIQSPEFVLLWLYESKGCLVPFSSLFLPLLSLSC